MDRNDEVTTPQTPREFSESPDFEYVTRKRKGKRRSKVMSLNNFRNKFSDSCSIGSVDSNIEEKVNNIDDVELRDSNVNCDVRVVDHCEIDDNPERPGEDNKESTVDRVSWDAELKAPPQILEPETPEKLNPECEVAAGFPKEEVEKAENVVEEPTKINTRALSKHSVTYELEKFKKNALLIFNQKNIIGFKPRLGTEKDVEELERTFSQFGFEVFVEHDLTKAEIMKRLREFSEQDFTDYGCVAVAVLTHGSKHGLLRAKDLQYSELEIVEHFRVDIRPTLVTKPKIIIIQACRGSKELKGVPVFETYNITRDLDEEVEPYTLPVESDMLILHSSYIGKPSHRDELLGSWFIQSLCGKINELASSNDFESIITEVKREVAIDRSHADTNRRTFEIDINKQMPVSTSTLIRKLYLKKFGDEPSSSGALHPGSAQMSDNNVLDNSTPSTPMLTQFGPCNCFLEHFNYLRNCLSYYLEDYPDDTIARSYLDIASTFEEGSEFNSAKERMLRAISEHLSASAGGATRYLYLYSNRS